MITMILPLIGAALGGVGLIGNLFSRRRANKELGSLLNQDPAYKENPLAQNQLALAQNQLQGRMPGASLIERALFRSQAGAFGNASKIATDPTQLLQQAVAGQANTDQGLQDIAGQEAADYQRRYGNVVEANQGVINEGDKVYQDNVRRFQDKAQIKGAQQQNRNSIWSSLFNTGASLLTGGLLGGGRRRMGGGYSGAPSRNKYEGWG